MSALEPRTGAAASSWRPVVAYAVISAVNQMLWLTYAPITTGAAEHYDVSTGAIGWLAEIFPLVYVVLALPAGRLIDRRLPFWLGVGAVLTAAGAVLRLAGDEYATVLAGQVLVAVAQPLVLSAVTSVSGAYLRERDRATGIAVSSAGIFAGMVLAIVLGAVAGAEHLGVLLAVQALLALVAAVWMCVAVRAPGSHAAPDLPPVAVRDVWSDRYLRVLILLACTGFGVFVALTTWLQALLDPAGVSEDEAGYLLLAMIVGGVVGAAALPPRIARSGRELPFVLASVLVGVAGLVVLALAPGVFTGLAVALLVGGFLLTDLPVLLALAERRAGPAGGTASALVFLAGNAAGLLAALAVQGLLDHPAAAFGLLAVCQLAAIPLLRALRTAADETSAGALRV